MASKVLEFGEVCKTMSERVTSCLWDTKPKIWYAVIRIPKFLPLSTGRVDFLYQVESQAWQKCHELNDTNWTLYRYLVKLKLYPTYPDNTIDWSYEKTIHSHIPIIIK